MGQTLGTENLAALAAGGSLLGAGTSIGTAVAQANAQGVQAAFEKQQYEFNAKVADIQGKDAIKRGDEAASMVRARGRQVQGAQRAAAAAQGIDPNSGTAAALQDETALFTELDANTVRANAFQEAFGYKVDAINSRGRGNMSQLAGNFSKTTTLLGGGLQALQYGVQAARYYGSDGGKKS